MDVLVGTAIPSKFTSKKKLLLIDYVICYSVHTCLCAQRYVIVVSSILSSSVFYLSLYIHRFLRAAFGCIGTWWSSERTSWWPDTMGEFYQYTCSKIGILLLIHHYLVHDFCLIMIVASPPFGGTTRRAHGNCCKFFVPCITGVVTFLMIFVYRYNNRFSLAL